MSKAVVTVVLYSIIFIMGAAAFSYVNVLMYRMLAHMSPGKECILEGKGRFCKAKMPKIHFFMKVLGGFFAVLPAYWFGKSGEGGARGMLQALLVFILLAILTVISVIDMDMMVIPKALVIAVLACGILAAALFPEPNVTARLIGSLAVSLPMGISALCIPGAFGGGDMKLMATAGFFLGWRGIVAAFFTAVLMSGFYCVYLLISKKKDRKGQFAFGPFLCAGIALSLFAGELLIQWYL